MHIGIFMHTNCFEDFFVKGLGISEREYVESYHNDFSFDYARLLREHGIETTIYNFTKIGSKARTYRHKVVDCTVKFIPVSTPYRLYDRIPFSQRTPVLKFVSQYVSTIQPGLAQMLQDDGIDVIYAQEYASGRFERLASIAKSVGIPIIAAYHGGSIPGFLMPIKKRTLQQAAYLTTLNEDEHRSMLSSLPGMKDRIRIIPNFVNRSIFHREDREEARRALGLDGNSRYIITVGRLDEHQKAHSLLVEAVKTLGDFPELKVLIAGSGPDEQELRKRISSAGLEDKIILLGSVRDKNELRHYYNACELFVLPSRYEGLPLVLLEAGACGLPAVAFNVMGVRGLIRDGENGLLAENLDPLQLAGALRKLLSDPEIRSEMGDRALDIVKSQYSEEIIGAKLNALFMDSVGGDSGVKFKPTVLAGNK
ncbi:Glycosyltransferase involved in cell wall bisynthesis [Paenibacillus sophorae]|uniref:Glycosyltransferase family 4 protein n=1 Tax=Paenibacillus sophorae TaxID=1333845 RepID=A0A1H8U6R6_9BACL|nr:glycosyltransferase family 4 protein [Paenibacillus sophorae]QWU17973.1 glycosyltransferase family 4 protein [Paenibacillus sophorae]SEO98845.1 Glycosyltransferase involved in cell wall bisynthesis [Paenibacillus sophorae]